MSQEILLKPAQLHTGCFLSQSSENQVGIHPSLGSLQPNINDTPLKALCQMNECLMPILFAATTKVLYTDRVEGLFQQ